MLCSLFLYAFLYAVSARTDHLTRGEGWLEILGRVRSADSSMAHRDIWTRTNGGRYYRKAMVQVDPPRTFNARGLRIISQQMAFRRILASIAITAPPSVNEHCCTLYVMYVLYTRLSNGDISVTDRVRNG